MQLTNEEQQSIKDWVEAGKTLAEIQTQLAETFSKSLTYMDVRFLLGDLGLKLKEQKQERPVQPPKTEHLSAQEAGKVGGVSVTVDKVVSAGAMMSGQVTFSDGETARWLIDALGQPRLEPKTPNYQPKQKDLIDFQNGLNKALQSQGF